MADALDSGSATSVKSKNLIRRSGGMADALDSGSSRGCSVRVQVPSPAPQKASLLRLAFCFIKIQN